MAHNDRKIHCYEGISHTPANIYALKAFCELIEEGQADNVPWLSYDDNAITASLDGAVVGILVWRKTLWTKSIIIKLGYVSNGFRGAGIYTSLWNELLEIAKKEKIFNIDGATHIDNKTMRAVARKQGRTEFAVVTRFIVPNGA